MSDFFPGDVIKTRVWIHEFDETNLRIVFMAKFINKTTEKIHAGGVQAVKIKNQHDWNIFRDHRLIPNRNLMPELVKCYKKLVEDSDKSLEAKARFKETFQYTITFGFTNHMGFICHYEYAKLFGEARELFGLRYIRDFATRAGKEFVLITNEAFYHVNQNFIFGDKVIIKIWVEELHHTYFILRAEFFKSQTNGLYATGRQRIVYMHLSSRKIRIPAELKKTLRPIVGYCKSAFRAKFSSSFLHILFKMLYR